MSSLQLFTGLGIDVAALAVLVFAIYYRRHRRSELLVALTALNLGVFAAVALLASAPGGMALGFGLFGILSIVRLRSSTLSQGEVGYYFIALTLGLINGLGYTHIWIALGLDAVLLAAMYGMGRVTGILDARATDAEPEPATSRTVTLDVVHADETALRADLERRLGVEVLECRISDINYVQDTTTCEVTCRVGHRTGLAGVKS